MLRRVGGLLQRSDLLSMLPCLTMCLMPLRRTVRAQCLMVVPRSLSDMQVQDVINYLLLITSLKDLAMVAVLRTGLHCYHSLGDPQAQSTEIPMFLAACPACTRL